MRCYSCDRFTMHMVCKQCQRDFLTPDISRREVGSLEVISFFDYYQVENYVQSKYIPAGYRIYKLFGKKYFQPFIKSYAENLSSKLYLIAVDESVERGYSNTAMLSHFGAKNSEVKALHNVLKAGNRVQYAGQPLSYRLENPKNFIYKGPRNIDVILIDDVVTTGTTLQQAFLELQRHDVRVHFALTVASANE